MQFEFSRKGGSGPKEYIKTFHGSRKASKETDLEFLCVRDHANTWIFLKLNNIGNDQSFLANKSIHLIGMPPAHTDYRCGFSEAKERKLLMNGTPEIISDPR